MKLIDLSMLISPTWRWPVELHMNKDINCGDPYQVSNFSASLHAFTHVDTPLHIELDRESIDQVSLNRLCGPAAVIDLTPVSANQEIGCEYFKKRSQHIKAGDIVLVKTCWDTICDYTTRAYWLNAPYISLETAQWLADQPIKAVGFDFPQDYAVRDIPGRHPSASEMPTHDLILRKGILLIEYLCNLAQLESERVTLYALPLKVGGGEGACARVVAVSG